MLGDVGVVLPDLHCGGADVCLELEGMRYVQIAYGGSHQDRVTWAQVTGEEDLTWFK